MLNNFHLAAIIREGVQTYLLQIPLKQSLQDYFSESWEEQFLQFTANVEEVDFDPGYRPERNERFLLSDYVPPDWLAKETSQSIQNLDSLGREESLIDSIKSLVGFARDDQGNELVLFQNFTSSRLIRPGRFLLIQHDTFISPERPGLTLDTKLSAVYQPTLRELLFVSFRNVNTFLPLLNFYREATEEDVREVLSHDSLAVEDMDASAIGANQWFSKRIAMLRDSGVLDQYPVNVIKARSTGHNVSIKIENNKIVFPSEKSDAKRLLQFLVEELYTGSITDTLYETNSKRQANMNENR